MSDLQLELVAVERTVWCGFLSVTKQGATILAEDADLPGDIDVNAARAAYEQATSGSSNTADNTQLRRARAQLSATGENP